MNKLNQDALDIYVNDIVEDHFITMNEEIDRIKLDTWFEIQEFAIYIINEYELYYREWEKLKSIPENQRDNYISNIVDAYLEDELEMDEIYRNSKVDEEMEDFAKSIIFIYEENYRKDILNENK